MLGNALNKPKVSSFLNLLLIIITVEQGASLQFNTEAAGVLEAADFGVFRDYSATRWGMLVLPRGLWRVSAIGKIVAFLPLALL